jgi:hypothetical protein
MRHRNYRYHGIDLWDKDEWKNRMNSIHGLVEWIGRHEAEQAQAHEAAGYDSSGKGHLLESHYVPKTRSVHDPEVLKHWEHRGIRFENRDCGGFHWISMVPVRAYREPERKLPTLIVLHEEDYTDPFYAMKTVEHFREYNEMALRDNWILAYAVSEKGRKDTEAPFIDAMYITVISETANLFPVDRENIYLDASVVYNTGHVLRDVPGFVYVDDTGRVDPNPDEAIKRFGDLNLPVLNISNRWQRKDSHFLMLVLSERFSNAAFDRERFIHSDTGRKLTAGMRLEYQYDRGDDPGLLSYWEEMGLEFESHDKGGERWTTLAPLCAYEKRANKLPVLLLMQEVNYSNDHMVVSALSYFHEYCILAAQGEFMILYFVLEHPDDNELLFDIVQDATAMYSIDTSRIYIAGHSHNGHYALEFANRHPETIAAVTTYGNFPGFARPGECSDAVIISDEKMEYMSTLDMPLINISGYCENGCMFPINREARNLRPGQESKRPTSFESRAGSWQRRLKASNCPMKTLEEIAAVADSPDQATRMLGLPNDKNETLYVDGCEHYTADIRNADGKYHLRMVGIENAPHLPTPFGLNLSWSFMKRFARNTGNGAVIELY